MNNLLTIAHKLLISQFGQINRLIARMLDRELSPLGISYQEVRIAGLLMGEDNITQKDLADKLSVRAATLSVAISKLEAQGLVTRIPSKTDKRVNYLRLNPNEKIAEVDNLLTRLENDITSNISAEDLQTTSRTLTQIINNIKNSR